MKRVAVVVAVALLAAVLAGGHLPARSDTTPLFEHYVGALHEHSAYSDGFPGSRPAHYYESGKAHGLDFLGGSEHSDNSELPLTLSEECLDPEFYECAIADQETPQDSLRKWDATLEQARAATDENFTGIRGFEWSSDRFGHINVYFSRNLINAYRDGGFASLESFWEWLGRDPALGGGSDGLATFNHPGDKSLVRVLPSEVRLVPSETDPGFNWNGFEYRPEFDQRMVGIELYNDTDDGYGEYYVQALDAGWHVGAIGAEDVGHRPRDGDGIVPGGGDPSDDWGGPAWAKTVIIATDKTEAGLKEAMLARRFYAVRNTSTRIEMSAGGRPMGSRVRGEPGGTVPISARVPGATSLEIVTNGGAVAASAEGDAIDFSAPVGTNETYYFLRALNGAGRPIAYSSPVWINPGGQWLAGDLHIHTTYSHDSYGGPTDNNTGPEEAYTLGHTVQSQFAVATARGLDYLAITDHNDIRSQSDPGWGFGGIIPVGGYENSLRGHAQMLGAHACYDDEGSYPGTDCGDHGNTSAAGVNATADALRADGGVFQINHPMEGTTDHGVTPDWGYGNDVVPDTIEVWNISRLWQPPAPSASSNDDAIRYWEGFLDLGHKVGVTGGSDNHYLATTPLQGAGQPTTWVYATERSESGILAGLRAGHTFISHQPPNQGGPQIFLEGDADGDGVYESIMGDTVPPESQLRVRVVNGAGSLLSVITDGGYAAFDPVPVTSPEFHHSFTLDAQSTSVPTWVRAEIGEPDGAEERATACDAQFGGETTYCRNRLLVLAMTSALYLAPETQPSETPTPTPTADPEPQGTKLEFTSNSAQSGQYSDEVRFEARLTTEDGTPLPNQEVAFELVGSETTSFTAMTDDAGFAQKTIGLSQKPGPYQLFTRYAGESDSYEPAANTMAFLIDKEDTDLSLVLAGKGSKRTLSATLADRDSAAGLAGRTIEFTADGTSICVVATNSDGIAQCSVPARYAGGHHAYEATFSGDDYYRSSSGSPAQ